MGHAEGSRYETVDNPNMTQAVLVSPSFLPGKGGIESHLGQLCMELAPRLAALAPAERDGKAIPSDLPYKTFPFEGSMGIPNDQVLHAIWAACGEEQTRKVVLGTPWPLLLLGPKLRARGLSYSVLVHGAELTVPAAIPLVCG